MNESHAESLFHEASSLEYVTRNFNQTEGI